MLTAGETVIRWRAPLVADEYGNKARNWTNATSTTYTSCAVALGSAFDDLPIADEASASDLSVLITDSGAEVLPTDRLEVRDRMYEVVGEPFTWKHPMTGTEFGVAARVRARRADSKAV